MGEPEPEWQIHVREGIFYTGCATIFADIIGLMYGIQQLSQGGADVHSFALGQLPVFLLLAFFLGISAMYRAFSCGKVTPGATIVFRYATFAIAGSTMYWEVDHLLHVGYSHLDVLTIALTVAFSVVGLVGLAVSCMWPRGDSHFLLVDFFQRITCRKCSSPSGPRPDG